MSKDVIADFLAIIANGVRVAKPSVSAPFSNIKFAIASILKDEGFVRDVMVKDSENGQKSILIFLKYVRGESVIHEITRKSKSSRRYYVGASRIKPVVGKLGVSILTTNKGVLSHKQAKTQNVGGELVCTVW